MKRIGLNTYFYRLNKVIFNGQGPVKGTAMRRTKWPPIPQQTNKQTNGGREGTSDLYYRDSNSL
jgi:hypothetical protein